LAVFVSLLGARASAAPTDPVQQGSIGLEGVVPSQPPTVASSITIPNNGQTFTEVPIKVSGICPEGLLIKLFKNGVFSGSAQCVGGSYSITADLFNGINELIVRGYDALDQGSPDSNKVTVTFNDTVTFSDSGPRISITSSFSKRGANPDETLTWPLILSGGTGPYAVSIDWGDGKTDLMSRTQPGTFDITHIYLSAGVYNTLIKITDSTGASAFLQVVSVANGLIAQSADDKTSTTRTVIIWWPMVIAAVAVCISFWLGRKDQLHKLRKEADKHIKY